MFRKRTETDITILSHQLSLPALGSHCPSEPQFQQLKIRQTVADITHVCSTNTANHSISFGLGCCYSSIACFLLMSPRLCSENQANQLRKDPCGEAQPCLQHSSFFPFVPFLSAVSGFSSLNISFTVSLWTNPPGCPCVHNLVSPQGERCPAPTRENEGL